MSNSTEFLQLAGFPTHLQHRLAFGLRIRDGVRTAPAALGQNSPFEPASVEAVAEWPGPPPKEGQNRPPRWQALLPGSGPGRFHAKHPVRPQNQPVTVRLLDPARRYVPRRVLVPFPSLAEVLDAEAGGGSLARAWTVSVWPGAQYPAHGGATGFRGRAIDNAGRPLSWVRVRATLPRGAVLGSAHGDDRGEFVLLLSAGGRVENLPRTSTFAVGLTFWVPPAVTDDPSYPGDPLTGLLTEELGVAGTAADGLTPPASYRQFDGPTVDAQLGRLRSIGDVHAPLPPP